MTLEDPVEYALPGIRQTAIDPPRLDFASGIRAMLRQDPDVLLIGEIRDEETAAMALRAAQTGHRVFSTLHASDPFAALPRLAQLGLPIAALHGNLNAIIAQRLVRKLCSACAIPTSPTLEILHLLKPYAAALSKSGETAHPLKTPRGCTACNGTGYLGRIPLIEILPFTDELANLLNEGNIDSVARRKLARDHGWRSLAEHGIEQVLAGLTTLEELRSVVSLGVWRDE
jgi:general secretion pathway protein E/type IV pilus assembly protein PilB